MKEKILIVDDSQEIRILLSRFLRASGYNIEEAQNGEQCLEKVRDIMPDLILLDIVMPRMDGYEVCEKLKSSSQTKDIPIIFLSARSEAADKVKGLALGGADYITKPFDRGEVMARIDNQLKIRRLTAALMTANVHLVKKQKALEEDLRAAATIQQCLLPQQLPQIDQVDIAWKFVPCEKISGDIFNVMLLDDDHLGLYIIDISGHGVPAALVTFSVSQALQPHMGYTVKRRARSPGYEIVSPAEVLRSLSKEFPWERFEKFLTITYLIVNVRQGTLISSNAAHPPPIVLHSDGSFDFLEKGGTIIGLDDSLCFEQEERNIQDGDKILLYTDGAFELRNAHNEMFGEKRFYELVRSLCTCSVDTMLEEILSTIKTYAHGAKIRDDVSLLGLEYKPFSC